MEEGEGSSAMKGKGPMEKEEEGSDDSFVLKLYGIVNDPAYDSIISWADDGNSFMIWDKDGFMKKVVRGYFGPIPIQYQSFVRQLQYHGFHKVKKIKEIKYEHDSFKQGKRELAKSIVSSRVLNTKAKKLANETASAEADKAKGYVLTPCEAAIVIVQLSAEDHARKTNRESSSEADGGPIGEPSGSGSGPLKVYERRKKKN